MGKLLNKIPTLLAKKDIRDNRRYTQRDMALGTGLSDTAISRIMRYKTLDHASFSHMIAIADWLGVEDLRDLVQPIEDEENNKES